MVQRINIGVAHRVGTYSDAALLMPGARMLLISGTPGLDGDSGQLPASFEAQAELAWQNVARILAAADMGIADIAKVTHHLVRREDLGGLPRDPQPASGSAPAGVDADVPPRVRIVVAFIEPSWGRR